MKQTAQQVDYRLGELLVDLGVAAPAEVIKGLRVSAHTSLPLGRTLVMLDYVPDFVVRSVVEAQSMLRDRLLELNQAKQALAIVNRKRWSFSDALISLGVDASATKGTRLGELLRDANRLNSHQLDLGLTVSDHSGLPLGQVLVLLSKVTEDKVRITLAMQRELRANNLERKDVLKRLASDNGAGATAHSLPAYDSTAKKIKLGELFICAEIITEEELQQSLSMGKDSQQMLGEILLDKQWISQDILTAALRLQALIWDEKIDVRKATDVLREAHRLAGTPDSADVDGLIADSGNKNVSLYEFLRITGYLTKDKIRASLKRVMDEPRLLALVMNHAKETDSSNSNYLEDATKLALRDAATLRFVMSETFPRDRGLVDSALVFHQLVQEGKLTLCQALVNYSIKINGIESDTAI
ncbi:hypothetical protein KF707_16680 [Candidatus Obscuribacterales bacterium]|nr:hypothetical protein [Candidatus Obscuribacterales bacterium]MBX3153042.1 hypothetical protein [Candidatus Obscuribacterales bacterium]